MERAGRAVSVPPRKPTVGAAPPSEPTRGARWSSGAPRPCEGKGTGRGAAGHGRGATAPLSGHRRRLRAPSSTTPEVGGGIMAGRSGLPDLPLLRPVRLLLRHSVRPDRRCARLAAVGEARLGQAGVAGLLASSITTVGDQSIWSRVTILVVSGFALVLGSRITHQGPPPGPPPDLAAAARCGQRNQVKATGGLILALLLNLIIVQLLNRLGGSFVRRLDGGDGAVHGGSRPRCGCWRPSSSSHTRPRQTGATSCRAPCWWAWASRRSASSRWSGSPTRSSPSRRPTGPSAGRCPSCSGPTCSGGSSPPRRS